MFCLLERFGMNHDFMLIIVTLIKFQLKNDIWLSLCQRLSTDKAKSIDFSNLVLLLLSIKWKFSKRDKIHLKFVIMFTKILLYSLCPNV